MPGYSRRSKKDETQHRLMSDSLSALCMPFALEEEGRVGGRLRVVGKRGGGGGGELEETERQKYEKGRVHSSGRSLQNYILTYFRLKRKKYLLTFDSHQMLLPLPGNFVLPLL